jgi:phage terminase small subunit
LSKEARAVWKTTVARLKGIELLDALDTDLLAMYCDIVAKYRALSTEAVTTDDIKSLQAWARLAQSYADKLGLSPAGRARLAKRKAEEKPPSEFEEEFD